MNTAYAVGLIDALANADEPLGALRHFAEHERVIREEFGIDPDPRVRLAAERVRKRLTHHPQVALAAEERRDEARAGAASPMLVGPHASEPAGSGRLESPDDWPRGL
jgi:DNA-binding SARP family transcriptional activator